MFRSIFVVALLFGALLAVSGCTPSASLEGTTAVTGTVTQNGAPLEGATVTLVPAPGAATTGENAPRAASGTTDASGKFQLTTLKFGDGAYPGEYQVTITKSETVGKVYTTEEANAYYNEHQKAPPAPETKQLLPEKYAQGATSGLTASVKQGQSNDFTFDVK